MSKTYTHKIEAKFRKNIINYSQVPENVKRKWIRNNNKIGYFRNLRNEKIKKCFGK